MLLSRSLGFWVGHSDFSLHSLSIQFIQEQQQMNVTHSCSFFADNLFKLFPNLENLLFKVHFFSKIPTKLPKQLNTDHSLITSKTWTRTTTWPTQTSKLSATKYEPAHIGQLIPSIPLYIAKCVLWDVTQLCWGKQDGTLQVVEKKTSCRFTCQVKSFIRLQTKRTLNFSRIAREKNSKVGYQSPHMR